MYVNSVPWVRIPLSPPPPTKENALRAFACRALETIARIGAMEEDESALEHSARALVRPDASLTGDLRESMTYNSKRRASPHCSLVNLVRSGRKQPQPVPASAGGQARH